MNQYQFPVPSRQDHSSAGYTPGDYYQQTNVPSYPPQNFYAGNYSPETYPIPSAPTTPPPSTVLKQGFDNPVFGNQFVQNVAMQYGSEAIGQSKQMVQQKVEKYISISRLKHYFSVDNSYVAGKLSILMFPFFHTSWGLKFDSSGPMPPRSDVNSPDLYIPVMAFITYILVSGVALGLGSHFSPESLGVFSSQSLGWLVLEICIFSFALYLLNIQSQLSYMDIMAYSGYKFVHMIFVILAFLALSTTGYWSALFWSGISITFFQVRSLKLQVLPQADLQPLWNPRRGIYLILFFALFQPLIIWWITSSVVFS